MKEQASDSSDLDAELLVNLLVPMGRSGHPQQSARVGWDRQISEKLDSDNLCSLEPYKRLYTDLKLGLQWDRVLQQRVIQRFASPSPLPAFRTRGAVYP